MKISSFLIFFAVMFTSSVFADENNKGFLDFKPEINPSGVNADMTPAQEERIRILINEALGGNNFINNPIVDDNGEIIETNKKDKIELDLGFFDYESYRVTAESETFYILVDKKNVRSILYKSDISKLKEKIIESKNKNKYKLEQDENNKKNLEQKNNNKNSKPIASIKGQK